MVYDAGVALLSASNGSLEMALSLSRLSIFYFFLFERGWNRTGGNNVGDDRDDSHNTFIYIYTKRIVCDCMLVHRMEYLVSSIH